MIFTPRQYQSDAVTATLRAWSEIAQDSDNPVPVGRKALLNMATGSGKTPLSAQLIKLCVQIGGRVLYVADRDELVRQPVKKIYQFVGIIAGVEKAEERASMNAKVVVASLQTLSKRKTDSTGIRHTFPRLERFPRDHFSHIIIDEAHRSCDQAAVVTEYFSKAKVVGMTATPYRIGLADLSTWYDVVAYSITRKEVVDLGYLVPLKVMPMGIELDVRGVHTVAGDFNEGEVGSAIEPYFNSICATLKREAKNYQMLSFLPLIRTSQKFVEFAQRHEITSEHCDGKTPDRDMVLERFESKQFQHLSNPSTFTTGVDFITADWLNMLRLTKSLALYQQVSGRLVRPLQGLVDDPSLDTPEKRKAAIASSAKPFGVIADFLWQHKSMGIVGPESLAANCAEDAAEIQKRFREKKSPQDLEEIAKIVQSDRENRLKKRLEWATRQRAEQPLFDAGTFAAMAHNKPILDYEPFKPREKWPVSDFSKRLLFKAGIDPESVRTQGEADVVLRQVGIRRHHKLPELSKVRQMDFEKAERELARQHEQIK